MKENIENVEDVEKLLENLKSSGILAQYKQPTNEDLMKWFDTLDLTGKYMAYTLYNMFFNMGKK